MRLIALDLGTLTGFAYTDDDAVHAALSGVWDLREQKHESRGARWYRFEGLLRELIDKAPEPSSPLEPRAHIFFEQASWATKKGGHAQHCWEALYAFVEYVQTHYARQGVNVHYSGVPVTKLKQRATGRGNADKAAMMAAAREHFGVEPEDDNHADALWVLQWAIDETQGGT